MMKLLLLAAVAVPLLAGCETTDWMADDSADYAPVTTSDDDPNASYNQFMDHQRQVNAENCAAASEGRDRVCYDD
jgi:hypothetical protein